MTCAWRAGPGGQGREQALDLRDGQRDHPWIGRRGLVRAGPGRGPGYRCGRGARAAVTAQTARAAMTSAVWRAIAVYSRTWDWSRPKQSLPNSKSSSTGQRSPAARISRVLVHQLAVGHVAVVEGQLAGLEVAADQQVMRGEAVASSAQAYQRAPLEPAPAERTSQRRLSVPARGRPARRSPPARRASETGESWTRTRSTYPGRGLRRTPAARCCCRTPHPRTRSRT